MSGSRKLTLHFVRHGETPGNSERRFQTPDVPLSKTGREQVHALAATLSETTRADVILTSDYARTMETAAAIGQRLGLPIIEEPALRERNFGIARGRLYAEIGEETLQRLRSPYQRIEQGESWADVYDRVKTFLDGLKAAPPAG